MSKAQRRLLIVLGVLLVATVIKVTYAWRTVGSNDTLHYRDFADYVHKYGPIGIYGHWKGELPYNHPPLVGWLLAALNPISRSGLPFVFLIRMPAILADIVTTVLVFRLLRSYRSMRAATVGALAVAISPVLIVISGYHGNTDPVFVMFTLLAFFLLHNGRHSAALAALAGVSFGLSISIKLVPIVVAPVLAVVALRAGRWRLVAFAGGAAVVFALLWVPVLVTQWTPFASNVLGYAGYGPPRWGIVEFLAKAGASDHVLALAQGPGRIVVLAVAALTPAVVAWRRPDLAPVAFGLSLSLFLLLSTATATQYLAWAAAPAVLVGVWTGALYNLAAGALLIEVYSRWSDAPPWTWNRADANPMNAGETAAAAVVWVVLLAVVLGGLWEAVHRRPRPDPAGPDDGPDGKPHTTTDELAASPVSG